MKKVLLLWYTINRNFGDVLIYRTVKTVLEEYNMQTGYMDVGEPCHKIFAEANKYDFLLFAGGGIIERYIPNVIRHFKEDFDELKVPYGIIGVSIGRFDYKGYKESLKFWIEEAEFFYTRDRYSAEYLNELCDTNKVTESVDVVWGNRKICNNELLRKSLKGVNIRDVPYLDIQNDLNWNELKNITKRLQMDCTISDESDQNLKVKLFENERPVSYNTETTLKQIWSCKFIIAMRYHVILVAAANGIPVIPIAYCSKIVELAKQLGIEKYVVEIDKINEIESKFNELQMYAEQEEKCLKENYIKMRETANFILNKICKIIKNMKEIKNG